MDKWKRQNSLWCAVKRRDVAAVKELLLSDRNPTNLITALPYLVPAVENDDMKMTTFLLEEGSDVNQEQTKEVDEFGFYKETDSRTQIFHVKTPLDVAAENGNEVIVSNLLKKGAKPEWQMEQIVFDPMFHPRGISALVSAICKNKRALISMLLNSGAEVNFVDIRRSQTPLDAAVDIGDDETVQELLKRGANIETRFVGGRRRVSGQTVVWKEHNTSALASAIRNRHRGVISTLIKSGANVNWTENRPGLKKTGESVTLRMIALEHGDEETAEALVKNGGKAREKDEANSKLILAVKQRRLADVRTLIKLGADCNYMSETGTPLECASAIGDEETVQVLLKSGAKIEVTRSNGDKHSALIAAVKHDGQVVIDTLLRAGANVNFTERIATSEVRNIGYLGDFLKEKTCALAAAIQKPNRTGIATLLRAGADVNWTSDLESLLECAVKAEDEDTVQELLKRGVETEIRKGNDNENSDRSALVAAIQTGNRAVIDILLKSGADIDFKVEQRTPLQYAVEREDKETVSKLLDRGAKLQLESRERVCSAIISAVKLRNKALMHQLIQRGADVNVTEIDCTGQVTPLVWAIRMTDEKAVRMLFGKVLKTDSRESLADAAALIAAVVGSTRAMVNVLLDLQVDVNYCNSNLETPLSCAALTADIKIVQDLLTKGATVETVDNNEAVSALVSAVKERRTSVIEALLDSGANVNFFAQGRSPLTGAVEMEDKETLQKLLKRGAKIESEIDGKTVDSALIAAIMHQRRDMINILLNSRADVNCVVDSRSPLICATNMGDKETFQELLKQGAKISGKEIDSALIAAIENKHRDMIPTLLNLGANVNCVVDDQSPLTLALETGDAEAMQELVRLGAKIEPKIGGKHLVLAIRRERNSLISVLVAAGADIAFEFQSWTPLLCAITMDDTDLLQTLLTSKQRLNLDKTFCTLVPAMQYCKKKTSLFLIEFMKKRDDKQEDSDRSAEREVHEKLSSFTDKRGNTLMHYAAEGGSETLTNVLIKAGCNPRTKNKEGVSPLMLACFKADRQLVETLLNSGGDLQDKDESEQNALHYLTMGEGEIEARIEMFKWLVSRGADCNMTDKVGHKPHEKASDANLKSQLQKIWKDVRERATQETQSQSESQEEKPMSVDVGKCYANDSEPIATLDVTVPSEGGHFSSGSIAVSFPSDSLRESVNVQVHLYADSKLMPVVNKSRDEYIVSPLLALEPHGLMFEKPVQVRFPFSVNPKGWHLSLKRAMCEVSAIPQTWEPIITYDASQTEQLKVSDCNYDLVTGTLSINHFCWYHWFGKARDRLMASKDMHFSLFGSRPNPSMDTWNLTIHCHDRCEEVYESLKKKEFEKTPKGELLCSCLKMTVGIEGDIQFTANRGKWNAVEPPKVVATNMVWDNFSCVDVPVPFAVTYNSDSEEGSSICLIDMQQGEKCPELLFNMALPLSVNEEAFTEEPTRRGTRPSSQRGSTSSTQNTCDRVEEREFSSHDSDSTFETGPDIEAEAERKLTADQIVRVAGRIAGDWEKLASYLSPEFFGLDRIREIKQMYDTPFLQARAALEMWCDSFHGKATLHLVIKALCEIGKRSQAVEVFKDDLVDFVAPL